MAEINTILVLFSDTLFWKVLPKLYYFIKHRITFGNTVSEINAKMVLLSKTMDLNSYHFGIVLRPFVSESNTKTVLFYKTT